ncbi:chorismate mutase [Tranquillimonas rosea]|uniref:chorismate mutase n=2 Tax=Tranquillimonas rosea TaxID=641238 RepID=A0A1H9VDL5_9RHOB|nr:chorismate mutase [Tranquillimonas rosea]SES19752.1 chorismate mutase [Tranquillimonas rosea]
MKPANECASMAELREAIDTLDDELVRLLAQRRDYIDRAVALKRREDLPARLEDRVTQVLERVKARAAEADLDPALAETLWTHLVEWSIAREERVLGE